MYRFWTVTLLRFVALFFVFAVTIAIYCYPGGNIHNPAQPGYSLTHNFLSDLGGYHSHSGVVNFYSAFFFNQAMFMFIGVGIGFTFVPRLFKADPLNYGLSIVGSIFFLIGTICFAGVGLTPHDLYRPIHVFLAVNAFRFLVPGALAYLIVLLRSSVDNKYALVTIFYVIATSCYVIYQLVSASPLDSYDQMVEAATIQKAIAFVSVATIFSLSFAFASQITHLGLR